MAFVCYTAAAGLGVYDTIQAYPTELTFWGTSFHPFQTFIADLMWSEFGINLLQARHILVLFLSDLVLTSALIATIAFPAQIALRGEIETRRSLTAGYLTLTVFNLVTWVFFRLDPVSRFINEADNSGLIGYLYGIILIFLGVYTIVALVVMRETTTAKALGVISLWILLFPIWLISVILYVLPFRKYDPGKTDKPPPFLGVLLAPRQTFGQLDSRRALNKSLSVYAAVFLFFSFIGSALYLLPQGDFPVDLESFMALDLLWSLLFQKAQLLLMYPYYSFSLDLFMFPDAFHWYDLLYLYFAGLLVTVVFTGASHITICRIMSVRGNYRALLNSFLYILNAVTLYLILPSSLIYLYWDNTSYNPLLEISIGFLGWGYFVLYLWLIALYVMAIEKTYALNTGRALGSWFVSVVLFVPVTVFTVVSEAVKEASLPFRIRNRVDELHQYRSEVLGVKHLRTEGFEPSTVDHEDEHSAQLDKFIQAYEKEDLVNRRARTEVGVLEPLQVIFDLSLPTALDSVLSLARHKDRFVREQAAVALLALFDASPDKIFEGYHYLIGNRCPSEFLRQLATIGQDSHAAELGGMYFDVIQGIAEGKLAETLSHARETLSVWRDRKHGDEIFLFYRCLEALAKANTTIDLERAELELVQALNVDSPLLQEVAAVFKPLLDISSNYLVYYGRAEFENKIPYLAAPIMILVDEDRKLEIKEFPPEDGLLHLILSHIQDIILREFDGLRGRADLHFELKPERAPFNQVISMVLYVRNQGSASAEKMMIGLLNSNNESFDILGTHMLEVDLLSPKREARLEYTIQSTKAERMRIPFKVHYNDLEKKGRETEFASVIEFFEPGDEAEGPERENSFVNPYITGLPVKNPRMFFGRKEVFRFIRSHLQGRHEKNILVLRGQRRTGKTSILYQLENQLDEKYIPVLLDLQGFANTGEDRFFYWIARAVALAIRSRGIEFERPRLEDFKDNPFGYFREDFLPRAWNAIDYRHLLLAFDEFEELAARVEDGKLDKDVFPYLRSLMQHTERLDFIFAGTHKMQQITHEYWSILFNIALFQDIGFMTEDEVADIIRTPVKNVIFYDDLAIEKVMRITAGHPYFVQMLGNKLVDYYLDNEKFFLTLQDVNKVLEDVIMGGALHFDYLWAESTPVEKLISSSMARIIAREGGSATLAEISNLFDRFELGLEHSSVIQGLKSLAVRQLIMVDADFRQFEFKIDLFRLWLDRYQRFGAEAESYREHQSADKKV